MIAIPPNHREYKLQQTAAHCNIVFEGETVVQGAGFDPHGVSKITIEDNRGTTCMMDTVFQGEIVVTETLAKTAGPETNKLFSADSSATTALDGNWGADQVNMTFADGTAEIEFGCASATIDAVTFTGPTTFTATGTHLRESGVMPPPGHQPRETLLHRSQSVT
jgi:hypothetical protein